MIRDVLLGIFGIAWLVVVVVTVWRTGTVPPELWAVLGVGSGGLLGVFRVDDSYVGRRRRLPDEPAKEESS